MNTLIIGVMVHFWSEPAGFISFEPILVAQKKPWDTAMVNKGHPDPKN